MSVLVFVDNNKGMATKASLEAVSYARNIADSKSTSLVAVSFGSMNGDGGVGKYGADELKVASNIASHDSGQLSKAVEAAAKECGADVVVFSHDHTGKLVAPRLAVRMKAGMVPGATELPQMDGGFEVGKNVFSGKASASMSLDSAVKIIGLLPNAFGLHPSEKSTAVSEFSPEVGEQKVMVKQEASSSSDGEIPLPEAELVVSAGRGMKGPENWGMVEELASILGAATACSRPVADIGWRPHHEHVGQTGVAIRPTLYIAIGISGAIQHLAGVNGSKVIVVINKDPEAPFFKAADYGIVGDAFEVLPKLVEAAKAFKNN